MKLLFAILMGLCSSLTCAERADGDMQSYTFPPFNPSDLAFGQKESPERLRSSTPVLKSEISYDKKSSDELRAIMSWGGISEQHWAARTLLQACDHETILRVISSLKQGNPIAEEILKSFPSRQIVPYLMEEVAHGNMDDYSKNWVNIITGRVRLTATDLVADILSGVEDFPEETMKWLHYVRFGDAIARSDNLSEKSKFLVEWWILNEKAFLAGKWDEMIPVPHAGSYTIPKPVVLQDASFDILPDVKPGQPWEFEPFEVSESFEDWSARIVHPERRDLSWVELTLVDGEWIPHPPKRLDPLAAPISPSRTIKRPAVEGKSPLATHQSPIWIAFFIFVLGILFWLWSKRSKTA